MYATGWQAEAEKREYFVLAPNSTDQMGWSGEDIPRIMSLVNSAQKQFGITFFQYFDGIATFMGMVTNSLGDHIKYQTEPQNKRPILLIHGKKDHLIPIKLGRENYQFLKNKKYPVKFKEEVNMGHEFYIKDCSLILDWFEKEIKKQ